MKISKTTMPEQSEYKNFIDQIKQKILAYKQHKMKDIYFMQIAIVGKMTSTRKPLQRSKK